MPAEDEIMEEKPDIKEEVVPFATVSILQLIKEAQAQHGLRHGDYNRYRTYCADRLKRMRGAEKLTNKYKCVKRHKAKFERKVITEEHFTNEKVLHLMLFECERRWAKAMNDKTFLEDNPQSRRRQGMMMNLKRALHHATQMEALVRNSPRCDAPTKLEAQAYLVYLAGMVKFEAKQWVEARENLKASRTVYERLTEATHNTTLTNLYKARCREIQPQLRLCEFNSEETGAKVAKIGELMELRMQINDTESIDTLIAEMRSKASTDDVIEITFGGDKATVLDEKARAVILAWRQADKELAECQGPKEKMALYEKQLGDTRDALDKMNDLIRRKTAENADTEILQIVRSYLDFLRLSRTAERYLAMIESTKLEKKYRPQDLLRLYDSVIEIFKEIKEINGAARDSTLISAYNTRIEYYRAFRCHYMAAAYAHLGKPNEASALFTRAEERIKQAEKLVKAMDKNNAYFTEKKEALDDLLKQNASARALANSQRLSSALADSSKASVIDDRPLVETLDEWRRFPTETAELQKVKVMRLPPAPLPMPAKPVFFDLAFYDVQMPDLSARLARMEEDRKASQQKGPQKAQGGGKKGGKGAAAQQQASQQAAPGEEGGLSGMVKGWFWGKK
ncbi:unnamed protein product, partial [Mesorhabditis belari]|uniref:Signal recognition particle subunit SRP68 n=1 Tax=Mesorhabditis belari TaxID=2138241 RepID=A0AAF3FDL5_9BILA